MAKVTDSVIDDPKVKLWYNGLSTTWSDVALRTLTRFCKEIEKTPQEYASLPVEQMEDLAKNYIQSFLPIHEEPPKRLNPDETPRQRRCQHNWNENSICTKCGLTRCEEHSWSDFKCVKCGIAGSLYSGGYADNLLTAIKSWATANRKAFQPRCIIIPNSDDTPSLEDEFIPLPEQLKDCIYDAKTDDRTRVSFAIIAFSGCRPEVLGNAKGTNGLKISDLPEMKIENNSEIYIYLHDWLLERGVSFASPVDVKTESGSIESWSVSKALLGRVNLKNRIRRFQMIFGLAVAMSGCAIMSLSGLLRGDKLVFALVLGGVMIVVGGFIFMNYGNKAAIESV